jgi:hypothetical protein
MNVDHDFYGDNDPDAPECIKNVQGEVVLGLCKVCGMAEADLADECPGARSTAGADTPTAAPGGVRTGCEEGNVG